MVVWRPHWSGHAQLHSHLTRLTRFQGGKFAWHGRCIGVLAEQLGMLRVAGHVGEPVYGSGVDQARLEFLPHDRSDQQEGNG